jgi:hypothetical protein
MSATAMWVHNNAIIRTWKLLVCGMGMSRLCTYLQVGKPWFVDPTEDAPVAWGMGLGQWPRPPETWEQV